VIAESKDPKSRRSKKRVAPFVARFSRMIEMLSAVDVRTDGGLSPKPSAVESMRAQAVPDDALSLR